MSPVRTVSSGMVFGGHVLVTTRSTAANGAESLRQQVRARTIAPPASPVPPIDYRIFFSDIALLWDAATGIDVTVEESELYAASWADTVRGTTALPAAGGAAFYQPSNPHFRGRPAIRTDRDSQRVLRTASDAALFDIPAGSHLYMGVVSRQLEESPVLGLNECCVMMSRAANQHVLNLMISGFASGPEDLTDAFDLHHATVDNSFGRVRKEGVAKTAPHLFEMWHDGNRIRGAVDAVDGTQVSGPNPDPSGTFGPVLRASFGCDGPALGGFGSWEITQVLIAHYRNHTEIAAYRAAVFENLITPS